MNIHNDLQRAKIPHSCKECCCKCNGRSSACADFYPADMPRFMEYTVGFLKETVIPCKEYKLKRYIVRDGRSYDDGITTLDGYYVQLINSVLCEIRKDGRDYIFNLEQLREIMRFEPCITARYIPDAGSYEIRIG